MLHSFGEGLPTLIVGIPDIHRFATVDVFKTHFLLQNLL